MPSSPPRRAASTPFGELLAVGGRVLAHDSAPELVVLGEQTTERAALGLEARVVDRATNRTSIARRGGGHKRGPAGHKPRRRASRRRLRARLEQPRIAQKARAQRGQRHAAFLAVGMTAGTAGPGMTGTLDQNSADDESGGSAVVGARDGSSVGCRLGERRLEARAPQRLERLRQK